MRAASPPTRSQYPKGTLFTSSIKNPWMSGIPSDSTHLMYELRRSVMGCLATSSGFMIPPMRKRQRMRLSASLPTEIPSPAPNPHLSLHLPQKRRVGYVGDLHFPRIDAGALGAVLDVHADALFRKAPRIVRVHEAEGLLDRLTGDFGIQFQLPRGN